MKRTQTGLRLPYELKKQLEQAAKENHRSVNSEILARLEQTFKQEKTNEQN